MLMDRVFFVFYFFYVSIILATSGYVYAIQFCLSCQLGKLQRWFRDLDHMITITTQNSIQYLGLENNLGFICDFSLID